MKRDLSFSYGAVEAHKKKKKKSLGRTADKREIPVLYFHTAAVVLFHTHLAFLSQFQRQTERYSEFS